MRCRYCGTELGSDADFCPNCGTPTGQQNMVPDDTPTCVASNYGLDDPGENTVNINPDDEPPTTQLNDDGPYYGGSTTFINGNGYSNDYGGGSYSGNQQNGYNGYSGGGSNYSTGGNSYSNGGNSYPSGSYSGGNNSYYQPPESGPDYGNDYKTDVIQEDPPYSPGTYPQGGGNVPKKKKTWIIWTIVAVLVVALLGGGGWFFLIRRSNNASADDGSAVAVQLDTTGYVQAEQSFVDFSDYYNGYALVTFFRSEGDPQSLTASLINKKGQLCPIMDGDRTINGIEVGKSVSIFPVQKSGLLIFSESDRVNQTTGKTETRMLAIDKDRNMISLNEKGYTMDDFLGTGEECILMKKTKTDKTGISSFNLLGMDGEVIKSFDVKGELQNAVWKVETKCAIDGKYFILKSNSGNKYLITKDSAKLFNPKEESFPAASADDEMIGLLDCSPFKNDKFKTLILTSEGEIKEVVGKEDYSNAGAVFDGYFFNPSSTDKFTNCSVVHLSDGKLVHNSLNFVSDLEETSDSDILCGFANDTLFISAHNKTEGAKDEKPRWHTYQFSMTGKQIGKVMDGYLTHAINMKQHEVYYLNDTPHYGLRFYESGVPVVIQTGGLVTFYEEDGTKPFSSEDYRYIYQFSDSAARAIPLDLSNDDSGYITNKKIDYSKADELHTFKQSRIVYLGKSGERLFKSVTFPGNY